MPEDEGRGYVRPMLRVNSPAAAYARRSDQKAKDEETDKSQSREMQTEDMIDWAIKQGWERAILFEYFADLGLSGTLRPDQRPDMLRLFDDIDAGRFDHGTVICWQENRLFRDETQIYYNQFIEKCKAHDVVVVAVSPYLMIYDFQDEFLTEMFRWKCKESADFIKRHIKGWMLPARHRAAWHDGQWAGLGDPPTGFIVDFDEHSPTYKRLIPYCPHIEKVKEHFQLYMELGGDISLTYRRLRESPIIFPEYEAWVDPRNANRFKMSRYPGGGYFPKGKDTIVSMLTNPIYIGYRSVEGVIRRTSKGEKIIEFEEPLIERDLFDFAYYRLARTDFDGNPIGNKRPRRFFQQNSKSEYGLLKFRITSTQGEVRTHPDGVAYGETPPGTGSYNIQTLEREHSLYHVLTHAVIPCEELDTLVVNRLMEHVHEISKNQEDREGYEKKARKLREERSSKVKQVVKSIADIEAEQKRLTAQLGKPTGKNKKPLSLRARQLILEQVDILEEERLKLTQAKETLEEQAEGDLGTLDDELKKLEAFWPQYTFEKRRSLMNFIIKEVVIEVVSTHWMRVEVLWLHEEWGREAMYWYRTKGRTVNWTEAEIALVREHYATMPRFRLMALLPHRGWQAIRGLGIKLKIPRTQSKSTSGEDYIRGLDLAASYSDLEFMQRRTIPFHAQHTNWEQLSLHC